MDRETFFFTIKKLEEEKKILLNTIDNLNIHVKENVELKQKLSSTESALSNSIDTLFFVLHVLKEMSLKQKEIDTFTHQQVGKMLNVIYNVLEGAEIEQIVSDSEIEDGIKVYQDIQKQIKKTRTRLLDTTNRYPNNPKTYH